MYELKKLERYLRVNLLGPDPRLIKKNYRAAVSQKLRNTVLEYDAMWVVKYLPIFWSLLPLPSRSNNSKHLFRVASTLKVDAAVYCF
jgi:hypothetical protein